MHQAYDGFHFILKKHLELSQKKNFWLVLRDFWFRLSCALWVTPQSSANLKILWTYIIVVSFNSAVLWLSSYKFSNIFVVMQHPRNGPLFGGKGRGSLGHFSCKYDPSLLKFVWQRHLNNLSKLIVSAEARRTQSWLFFFHFGAQFTPQKN